MQINETFFLSCKQLRLLYATLTKGNIIIDTLAEWSKALVLGTSPKGRGFKSHRCQFALYFYGFAMDVLFLAVVIFAVVT